MLTRIFQSAVAGLTITAALLYLMHYLINVSEGAVDPSPPIRLDPWGTTYEEVPVKTILPNPKPIDPPALPPRTRTQSNNTGETIGIGIAHTIETPVMRKFEPGQFGYTDGALINIVPVRPAYPTVALSRGIEGHVVVQFDVTVMGTVENASVFETTSSLFNRSALAAIHKFRFKPRVVNGVPQESHGVQRLFTFEID